MSDVSENAARKGKLLEEFEKNPENVILRDQIIFGAVSTGDGRYGIQSGSYPVALVKMACYDLFFRSIMMFQHMEMMAAAQKMGENRILTPNGEGSVAH